jgi:predicted Zn-dependent protease
MKIIYQFAIMMLLMGICWYTLSCFNFIETIKINDATVKINEQKIGDLLWQSIQTTEVVIDNDSINNLVENIKTRICEANKIDATTIKIHIVEKAESNAFAMPNRHLIIYSKLILDCDNADELAGVMAHEIAHMQHEHVMKKMIKELGLGVLLSVVGGNANFSIIKKLMQNLTSTAYDRNLESEADATAFNYLVKAKINPYGFANILEKFSKVETELSNKLSWLSTHPESKERANIIHQKLSKTKCDFEEIVSESDWMNFKEQLKML